MATDHDVVVVDLVEATDGGEERLLVALDRDGDLTAGALADRHGVAEVVHARALKVLVVAVHPQLDVDLSSSSQGSRQSQSMA